MRATIKLPTCMWNEMQSDLRRPHAFAHERVGFLAAGVAGVPGGDLLVLARTYRPVDEEDYLPDPSVGVKIGPGAMRKAMQTAYRPPAAILHVHTHGGKGRPEFSSVDHRSAAKFVPSFFNAVPRMPHGILVLSNNSATGLLWYGPDKVETYVAQFITVGAPYRKFGAR